MYIFQYFIKYLNILKFENSVWIWVYIFQYFIIIAIYSNIFIRAFWKVQMSDRALTSFIRFPVLVSFFSSPFLAEKLSTRVIQQFENTNISKSIYSISVHIHGKKVVFTDQTVFVSRTVHLILKSFFCFYILWLISIYLSLSFTLPGRLGSFWWIPPGEVWWTACSSLHSTRRWKWYDDTYVQRKKKPNQKNQKKRDTIENKQTVLDTIGAVTSFDDLVVHKLDQNGPQGNLGVDKKHITGFHVEIMESQTCGGNRKKQKQTQISYQWTWRIGRDRGC